MKKLEIFGDSVLKGVIYNSNKRYELCENNKLTSLEKYGIKVKNNSRMGATISKGLELIDRRFEEIGDDTVVMLEFGSNDCDYDWKSISENPYSEHLPNICYEEFRNKYTEAVRRIRSVKAEPVIVIPVPIDAEKFFDKITEGNDKNNIMKFLGDISMLSRWQEYYSRIVERLATDLKCKTLDLRSPFLMSHNIKNLLCADGIHPTVEGHSLIQNVLDRFVSQRVTAH